MLPRTGDMGHNWKTPGAWPMWNPGPMPHFERFFWHARDKVSRSLGQAERGLKWGVEDLAGFCQAGNCREVSTVTRAPRDKMIPCFCSPVAAQCLCAPKLRPDMIKGTSQDLSSKIFPGFKARCCWLSFCLWLGVASGREGHVLHEEFELLKEQKWCVVHVLVFGLIFHPACCSNATSFLK